MGPRPGVDPALRRERTLRGETSGESGRRREWTREISAEGSRTKAGYTVVNSAESERTVNTAAR